MGGEEVAPSRTRVLAHGLAETTDNERDRSFVYRGDLGRLRVGTELGGAQVPGR